MRKKREEREAILRGKQHTETHRESGRDEGLMLNERKHLMRNYDRKKKRGRMVTKEEISLVS